MKKTILVPTDFSVNARSAVNYAIDMAEQYSFGIHLVHIYAPMTTRFGDDAFNNRMVRQAREEAEESMQQLVSELTASHRELEVFTECLEGDHLADTLTRISGKASHQLIVMGTRGAGGLKYVLGSNTYQTILNAPLPVMAIPENYSEFRLSHAGLLSNFKKSDIALLETFASIFGREVKITLLHVRETDSPQEEAELIDWKNHLEAITGISGIQWKIDTVVHRLDLDDNIPECIHDMAEEAQLDALLITSTPRSFFRRVFSRSLVKNIAHEIHRPVFFLPEG